jgi:LacI family transcriptional regulator
MIEQFDPRSEVSSVAVNDVTGGSVAARHLLRSGRQRLAFVGNPEQVRHVNERWQGFCAAVSDSSAQVPTLVKTRDLTMRAGLIAADELFARPRSERPDGIFAANDLVALGILQACLRLGVRLPDDVALVGFDDIEFAAQAAIPLTTVRQPAHELGMTAAQILIEDMRHPGHLPPQHVLFEPELIVRQSAP